MAVSFSVIVPVYNKRPFVKECIDSLLAQSHTDFEVVCVDDGSTDGSLEVLRTFSDPRVKLITKSNSGVSDTRNVGIEAATKDYILFVDCDDLVQPDYLEKFANGIEKYACDILIGGLTAYLMDGTLGNSRTTSLPDGPIAHEDFMKAYIPQMQHRQGVFGFVAGKAVSREFVHTHNIRFNRNLKLAEDMDFWISVFLAKPAIALFQYSGYLYRANDLNSSTGLPPQCLSQIELWKRVLNNIAIDDAHGREYALSRVVGFAEAHIVQLEDVSYGNIKAEMGMLNNLISSEVHSQLQAETKLQTMILKQNVLGIWLYMCVRKMYHSLR